MSLRAGIYGRNSKGVEKSVADQLTLGRRAVREQDWSPAREYSDDTSASRYRQKEREDWPRLLADLDAGRLDVLVLWNVSRGDRDEIEWLSMLRLAEQRSVRFYLLADERLYDPRIPRDWKTLAEEGIHASHYSRELSRNVRRGVAESALGGDPHGRPAFGYDRAHEVDPQTGRVRPRRVPNAHAVIVREIFRRLATHTPISELERDFAKRGVTMPDGKPLRRNTIRIIATNVAYIGIRRHQGEDRPAKWPALVEEAIFWDVQKILGAPERKTTKPAQVRHLLSHLMNAPCGDQVTRKGGRRGGADLYGCPCGCVSILKAETDALVERVIVARLSEPDALALVQRDDEEARKAQAELARLEVQLEEARQSFEAPDGISAEALARKERALMPLIEDARTRTRSSDMADGLVEELARSKDPTRVWAAMRLPARRAVIGRLTHLVLGQPGRRMPRGGTPEERARVVLERLGDSRWTGDELTWREHLEAEESEVEAQQGESRHDCKVTAEALRHTPEPRAEGRPHPVKTRRAFGKRSS